MDHHGVPDVSKRPPNNFVGLDKHYRSAHLLLRQADTYRLSRNQYQLYAMLMRFASLLLETIPEHKDFEAHAPPAEHRRLTKLLRERYLPELERTKQLLQERAAAGMAPPPPSRDDDPAALQLSAAYLPELTNWGSPAAAPDTLASLAPHVNGTAFDLLTGDPAAPRQLTAPPALPSFDGGSSLRLPIASEAARSRHTLLARPATFPSSRAPTASYPPAAGPLYPRCDPTPLLPIDYGLARSHAGAAAAPSGEAALGPSLGLQLDQLLAQPQQPLTQQPQSLQQQWQPASLLDADQAPSAPALPVGDALDRLALQARPQLEPQLGPQEMQVYSAPGPTQPLAPGESCSHAEPGAVFEDGAVVPALGADAPGAPPKERQGIRSVHVSQGLMDEFLKYATSNTRRGIESCGILAGTLDDEAGIFAISTLIIPKQEGTSDTVQALAEEEIFDVQDKRQLYPLGWIHTHPTQICFLSSVDMHTQCGYQTMLEEAVAIVMAPRDPSKRCGIFRLTTPGGLKLVQKCPHRGFHTHPPTDTGQDIYGLCNHVFLNPRVVHDVVDLR